MRIVRIVSCEAWSSRGDMVAYEFYWRDDVGDAHLVGILPERRKDSTRITDESIMNWVKRIVGNDKVINDIFFSRVNINGF